MRKLVAFWVLCAMLSGMVVAYAQDDELLDCDSTYQSSAGTEATSVPVCRAGWVDVVERDLIIPSMRQLNLGHIGWTDHYGRGNGIRSIYDNWNIDLSSEDNTLRNKLFTGEYDFYAAGTRFYWGPGAEEDMCGLVVRRTGEGESRGEYYYAIQLRQNGRLRVREHTVDGWLEPSWYNETGDVPVASGEGNGNALMVYVLREFIHVFVNGEYVAKYDDRTHMDQLGRVGLAMSTFDESGETYCEFEHAWIWPINDWEWK